MKRTYWDLFCKVIDNFGDIGVTYRLAKELQHQGNKIRIFIDNLSAFHQIEKQVHVNLPVQIINNLEIYEWHDNFSDNIIPGDVVIELFACHLPENYIKKISSETLWINLEYLSAESWVESCHLQPSIDHGKKKYFFFPGFTSKTGGVNFEDSYLHNSDNSSELIDNLESELFNCTKTPLNNILKVSVFTYESEYLLRIIEHFQPQDHKPLLFFIPEGRFSTYAKNKGSLQPVAESIHWLKSSSGNFVSFFPMVGQNEYDKILRNCDINFVRGEDSFIRAQMASKPFIWHIYPQDENYHLEKLKSFLNLYTRDMYLEDQKAICRIMMNFNTENLHSFSEDFSQILCRYSTINTQAEKWFNHLIYNKSLATNLLIFAQQP
ncbi:MAG: elongation factor P maturation arginine rhamnosyltransferase EarP [Succinivibrionaceae bacterium]